MHRLILIMLDQFGGGLVEARPSVCVFVFLQCGKVNT